MNKSRRKTLNGVLDTLEKLQLPISKDEAVEILQNAMEEIEECAEEEEEALDNRPESLAWSAVSDEMSENVSDLRDASSDLDVLIEQCEDANSYSYNRIKKDLGTIINNIAKAINR